MKGFFDYLKINDNDNKKFDLSQKQKVTFVDRSKFGGVGQADNSIVKEAETLFKKLEPLDLIDRVETINAIRQILHDYSPFNKEPIDCVQWVRGEEVTANDYNPNVVAPPEMKLLEHSIDCDGYTQPIVAWRNGKGFEVVDGFHRNRVGKESQQVQERLLGYLPLSIINSERGERKDRIAATIRHNRARGKHTIEGMKDIVIELKRRNWTDERIAKELGMEPDEILRLCQINGLLEMFSNVEFSKSWETEIFDETSLSDGDEPIDEEDNG